MNYSRFETERKLFQGKINIVFMFEKRLFTETVSERRGEVKVGSGECIIKALISVNIISMILLTKCK